jgi:hypothetical protein
MVFDSVQVTVSLHFALSLFVLFVRLGLGIKSMVYFVNIEWQSLRLNRIISVLWTVYILIGVFPWVLWITLISVVVSFGWAWWNILSLSFNFVGKNVFDVCFWLKLFEGPFWHLGKLFNIGSFIFLLLVSRFVWVFWYFWGRLTLLTID